MDRGCRWLDNYDPSGWDKPKAFEFLEKMSDWSGRSFVVKSARLSDIYRLILWFALAAELMMQGKCRQTGKTICWWTLCPFLFKTKYLVLFNSISKKSRNNGRVVQNCNSLKRLSLRLHLLLYMQNQVFLEFLTLRPMMLQKLHPKGILSHMLSLAVKHIQG